MYSYEKQRLHFNVMADKFKLAAKYAKQLAEFENYSIYPVERANKVKQKLRELLDNIDI